MKHAIYGNFARICFALLTVMGCGSLHAQNTLVGNWEPLYHEDFDERAPGPAVGDYAGLPVTDAARLRADSWDASLLTLPEHQCKPHPSTYGFRGVGTLRVWETRDPETQQLIKIDTRITWQAQHREIWMDGRASPPTNALHTWQGFSRGRWEGNVLVVETDHLKAGWVRRNGVPLTDRATMKEYFFRHGDLLTHVSIVSDPVYLTEPLVRSNNFRYAVNASHPPYPCRPAIEVPRAKGEVPHHLPGQNGFLSEAANRFGVPFEALRGGAHTARPEYADALHAPPVEKAKQAVQPSSPVEKVDRLPVQGNVHLLSGAGGNVIVQTGSQGVLVVDAGHASATDPLLENIRAVAGERTIRYVINTHAHADHIGGNERLRKAGATIMGGNVTWDDPRGQQGATVIAHENTQLRLALPSLKNPPVDQGLWPTETFATESTDLHFNDEAVQLIHVPAAHTDGDVMVFFRKSDVLATGDVFITTAYPVIDVDGGGTLNGIIAALNRVIEIAVPRDKQEGGTIIVPGHGRLCDEADVVEYRDMLTIIRDRVQHLISQGKSLQQVQAARPTQDYDGRYGTSAGTWTTERFVEAAYNSLSAKNTSRNQAH